jgi:hypothetical protein
MGLFYNLFGVTREANVRVGPLPDIAVSESAGLPIPNLTLLASCGAFFCRQCMIEGPALGAFAPSAADDV